MPFHLNWHNIAISLTLTFRVDGTVRQQVHSDPKPASSDSRDPVTLNNSALELAAEGKYIESELLYNRALAILEKGRGPNHPDVATVLNVLAALFAKQGKYTEAEPLTNRVRSCAELASGSS